MAQLPRSREALDNRILAAHARGDEALLAALYWDAARAIAAEGKTDEACFFAVQAYALALSAGSEEAPALRSFLKSRGREE